MSPQAIFIAKLTALAQLCNFSLSPTILELYDTNLRRLGYQALCNAIDQVIIRRKSRDPFPSISEIAGIIEPSTDPELEAIEAANRIVEAITRYGYTNPERAKEFIGELGWRVVTREGGWENICRSVQSYDALSTHKAQWRQLAKATLLRGGSGSDSAPALPAPKSKKTGLTAVTDLIPQISHKKGSA